MQDPGHKEAKTDEKTGSQGVKSQKAAVRPSALYQLLEADITYIHYVDGWCYCFNVADVLGRKWLSYVFSPSAKSSSAVESVLAAVEGLSPDQIKWIRVRCNSGSQYTSGKFRKAMSVLGIRWSTYGSAHRNRTATSSRSTTPLSATTSTRTTERL